MSSASDILLLLCVLTAARGRSCVLLRHVPVLLLLRCVRRGLGLSHVVRRIHLSCALCTSMSACVLPTSEKRYEWE